MKAILQRVKFALVEIDGLEYSKIDQGLLIFLGAQKGDQGIATEYLAQKSLNLRIFEDENGKMNKSIIDIKGQILIVSQFTLLADCKKGTRPSFDKALEPHLAKDLYEFFIEELKKSGLKIQTGVFGADMKVSLLNDGPVTIILEK